MKTTSFLISKKLAEIGFKAESNYYWYLYDNGEGLRHISEADGKGNFKSFDLETILEALPKKHDFFSRGIGKYELRIWYHEGKAFVGYQNYAGFDKVMTFEQEQNESLADTAARLWLELKKKNIF